MDRRTRAHVWLLTAALVGLAPALPAAAWFEHPTAALPTLQRASAVAVDGTRLLYGDGLAGLRIFDASDPLAPVEGSRVDTPGYVLGIAVAGDLAFVADFRAGLRVIDLGNTAAAFERGSIALPGDSRAVAVRGNRAYVADESFGVRVVDISDPARPREDHRIELGACVDLLIVEDTLYAACGPLEILDVSDPDETTRRATQVMPSRSVAVTADGDWLYVACVGTGVWAVDVSNPASPQRSSASGVASDVSDLAVHGGRVIAAQRNTGLRAFDFGDPEVPFDAGRLEIEGKAAALAVAGDLAYLASEAAGLRVIDLRPPCIDGVDNDADGKTDFPEDPGCRTAADAAELPECSDGLDDDGDGLVDLDDPGCSEATDRTERALTVCDDGLDNDGDGLIDTLDPGCVDVLDASETSADLICDDGIDNDGDGLVDHPDDPHCDDLLDFSESAVCANGIDDDGDTSIDFPDDPGCIGPGDESERLGTACDDGIDQDEDGVTDYPADPGCDELADETETNAAVACDDGIDNDGDGGVDRGGDPGCRDLRGLQEDPACDNGIDDDADGNTDHPADAGCAAAWDHSERHDCGDGLDNDGDGAIDFGSDFGCASPNDGSERTGTVCDDGIDNDGDDRIDVDDPGCLDIHSPTESPACDNGLDDDGDAAIDFPADPGCDGSFDPSETGLTVACDDGVDNDVDGLVDFPGDPGCRSVDDSDEIQLGIACDDGIDNDADGLIDFGRDPECADPTQDFEAPACDDGIDNDADGRIDELDPGCAAPEQNLESPACNDGYDNDGDLAIDLDDPECESASDLSEWLLDPADVIVVQPRAVIRVAAVGGLATALASGAPFDHLADVALVDPGRLVVSDIGEGAIFAVAPGSGIMTTIVDGLDLGGSSAVVGGGLAIDAQGQLLVAAAAGILRVHPVTGVAEWVVEGEPGPGFLGNHLDVARVPGVGVYASRFSPLATDARIEVLGVDLSTGQTAPLWSAEASLGPGFNGSLAVFDNGDLFVSHGGVVSLRNLEDEVSSQGAPASSAFGGFSGLAPDVGDGLLVIEHCGPVGGEDCPATATRVLDAAVPEVVPGAESLLGAVELLVVPHDCADGRDDDGDGFVDDDDPDCRRSSGLSEWRPVPVPAPGLGLAHVTALLTLAGVARRRRRVYQITGRS